MKKYLAIIYSLFFVATLSAATFSTGDFILSKKAATGPDTPVAFTPTNSSLWKIDGTGAVVPLPIASFPETLLDDADAPAVLGTLGFSTFIKTLVDDADAAAARATLGAASLAANTFTGVQTLSDTTASTSSLTGALIVAGGVGIAKDSWINSVRIGLGAGSIGTNTVVGANSALGANTTGFNNTVIGSGAAPLITTSTTNTIIGAGAGAALTLGGADTIIGANAFSNATTTGNAIAIGSGCASSLTAGGGNVENTVSGNIYMGVSVTALNNAQIGTIAIGYAAASEGSYHTVIGNLNTTTVNIWGKGMGGTISGLTLSSNASDAVNDVDIEAGECRDATRIRSIVYSGATKQSDAAWAAGSAAGWLDTGSIADGTYYIWLIYKSSTATVDSLLSLSATAPTMPSGYDYKRRIGMLVRMSSAIHAIVMERDGMFVGKTITDFVTTSATSANTGLQFYAAASESWVVETRITNTAPAAGTKEQVTAPTSAVVEGWFENFNAAGSSYNRITAINTLSAAMGAANTGSTPAWFTLTNSTNAGVVAIGAAATTGGQTVTLPKGANFIARRCP
jgi:hypothetical protein